MKLKDIKLIITTGLHQQPHEHLTFYWRLKEHVKFADMIGIKNFSEILPRMSRDFLVNFSNKIDAINAEKRDAIILELQQQMEPNAKIRALVHSIAKGNLKPMVANENPSLKNDDFILTINAMAISLYDWTQAIFEANLFAKDTRIISFTSEGNTKAWKHYAAVSAAKVTLEAITRNIALEFAPLGIKANCIQAGVTDTPSLRLISGYEKMKAHNELRNPFKRLTTPEDVANVVYLLCKDEASWINGSIIPVDGGEHIS